MIIEYEPGVDSLGDREYKVLVDGVRTKVAISKVDYSWCEVWGVRGIETLYPSLPTFRTLKEAKAWTEKRLSN